MFLIVNIVSLLISNVGLKEEILLPFIIFALNIFPKLSSTVTVMSDSTSFSDSIIISLEEISISVLNKLSVILLSNILVFGK